MLYDNSYWAWYSTPALVFVTMWFFAEIINLRITRQFSLELFRVHSQTLPVEDLAVETAVCTLTKSRLEDRQRMKHPAWRYLSSYFTSKYSNQNKPAIQRNTTYPMKFPRADGRVRMWRFSDIPGNNSVLIFRSCWWFGSTKTDDFSFGATKSSHPDAALCQRNFHWILSPRKLKTYTTYSVDKMLSIKPKDASLALSHHTFCFPQSRSLCYDGNEIAYQVVWAFYLRLAAGHIIALLHDMPDLPGDGAVGNNHYARWYHQDQQQHVDLVEAPEWRHIHNWNTVERRAFLSYCGVILVKKIIYVSCVMRGDATLDFVYRMQCSRSEP